MLFGFYLWPLGLFFSLCCSFQGSIMDGISKCLMLICCCFTDKKLNPLQNVEKLLSIRLVACFCCPVIMLVFAVFIIISILINAAFCMFLTLLAVFPVYFFLIAYYINYFRYFVTKCCIYKRQRKAKNLKTA